MIKIATHVAEIVQNNEIPLESMRGGIMNFSSYARQIKPEIEKKLMKKIREGTIVTALSRLSENVTTVLPLRPLVKINDISIKAPLVEISYDRSANLVKEVNAFQYSLNDNHNFVTVTAGLGEVTMILPGELKESALKTIHQKPKGVYEELVAITIRFNESEYIEAPNVIYSLVAILASRRINIIEVVSTFTEMSFIVKQVDMNKTVEAFKNHLGK